MAMNTPKELVQAFRKRPLDANKRTVGTVTIVGGSAHYVHAPVIAGLGARAAGAGLVHLVVPDASRIAAGALVPEATFLKLTSTCVPPKADVTVMGMGLGTGISSELIVSRLLSGSNGRFVLDADALNAVADEPQLLRLAKALVIITPHPAEMARLCGTTAQKVNQDRAGTAKRFAADYHVITVLKGAGTVIAAPDGRALLNTTGNSGMATGGSGDVLAGMCGALLAQGKNAFDCAAAAVYLHGRAGDLAARRLGKISMLPSDIIDEIPNAFTAILTTDKR